MGNNLLQSLVKVHGRYTENADLSKTNWFRVGGNAEVLFKPADLEDLPKLIAENTKAGDIFVCLGAGSITYMAAKLEGQLKGTKVA